MAFELIERMRYYHCESGDVKKTEGIEEGSVLFETDTGLEYMFDGTSWVYNPTSIQISNGTNTADIIPANGEYGLVTVTPGHLSAGNSTSTPLAAGATFTGIAEDVINHGVIVIAVKASHDSETDGLCVEYSTDGVNWDCSDEYTIFANEGKTFSFQPIGSYFRIKYTNGGTEQTYFRLQSVLKPYYVKPSSHRVADSISGQDDAELQKSVLTAQKPDTNFVNIGATDSGNLKITDAENPLAIAKGQVIGSTDLFKFGNAPDFDEADGEVTVWDGAEDGETWELMKYQYSTTAAIDSISSTVIGDTNTVEIQGLDAGYNLVNQTITLNGQNRVAFTTPLLRVFRAFNNNGTVFTGHVIIYENTPLTGGVPINKTKIRAVIHPENQQTEMALYTIPAGYTGYLTSAYSATAGANRTSNYIIRYKIRKLNGVFRLQQKVAIGDNGTSFINYKYDVPLKYEEKTDIEVTAQMTSLQATGASISAGFSIILVEN